MAGARGRRRGPGLQRFEIVRRILESRSKVRYRIRLTDETRLTRLRRRDRVFEPGYVTPLAALRRLSVILGVHFLEEEGDDLVAIVRQVAVERGSTYVFVGTPDESRRREIFGGSLLSRMVRELPGIDIRVVASRGERSKLEAEL